MAVTINASTSAGLVQTADTSGVLALQTSGTTAVTVDASQNVTLAGTLTTTGITNSGVATATRFNPTGSSVTGNGMYLPAANSVGISTNGTNAVYIDSSQNVGIGISSLASFSGKLVVNNGTNKNITLRGSIRLAGSTIQSIQSDAATDSPLEIYTGSAQQQYEAGFFTWLEAGTERMRIDSSGNLMVGQTTLTNVRCGVKGSDASSSNWSYYAIDSAGGTLFGVRNDGQIIASAIPSSTGTTLVLTAGGYITKLTSSIRYKKDVEPIDIGLDFILGLEPVKFKLKDGDTAQVGFIAENFPDSRLVSESYIDISDETKGLQRESVNYAQIVAPLVKAMQEQQALITQLQADVAALKGA